MTITTTALRGEGVAAPETRRECLDALTQTIQDIGRRTNSLYRHDADRGEGVQTDEFGLILMSVDELRADIDDPELEVILTAATLLSVYSREQHVRTQPDALFYNGKEGLVLKEEAGLLELNLVKLTDIIKEEPADADLAYEKLISIANSKKSPSVRLGANMAANLFQDEHPAELLR